MTGRGLKTPTLERIREAYRTQFHRVGKIRAPSIAHLAQFIRERWPGLRVRIERADVCFERRTRGKCYVNARWYREGTRLRVWDPGLSDHESGGCWHPWVDHNTAETYRRNADVCRWILDRIKAEGARG